jgi:hypothetical protein
MATIDQALMTNPAVTPYVWEAQRNGLLLAVECPPGDVPDTPFSAIGFVTRMRGVTGLEIPTFVNLIGDTVRMKARSLREASCPMLEIDIEPGDALIWAHRRVQNVFAFQGPMTPEPIAFETLLFGRESVAGVVQIAQVWPNGETVGFDSYAAAMNAL